MKGTVEYRFLKSEEAAAIRDRLPTEGEAASLAEFYKMFGDPTRMKLLCLLAEKELCVGDIALFTGSTPSAISHQLKTLRAAHLVRYRRAGKTLLYSLADEHVQTIIATGTEHIRER